MTEPLPRCGDHVRHASGEVWVVAFVEYGRLAWAGWPEGTAALDDCEIIYRATDDEHRAWVDKWRDIDPATDMRPRRVLRLYGAKPDGNP